MASDADSAKPADETPGAAGPEADEPGAGADPEAGAAGPDGTADANRPDDTEAADGPDGTDGADEPGGGEAADGPAEVARRGGPGLFLALTCGFLVCLCCIGAVFVGGSVAWVRMSNLDDAVERLGVPDGWHSDEESSLPWGAEVRLSGPAEAEPVREWLERIGTPPSGERMASCLESEKKFTVDGFYRGFPVSVEFRVDGDESVATVHVG